MRVKITVETGPVGDHEPEVFEGNLRAFLYSPRLYIHNEDTGQYETIISTEDFTQYTVELLDPL